MWKRFLFPVLVLASAGCAAAGGWPGTWVEPVLDPPRPGDGARVFLFNRQWQVGDCTLLGGSHVTLVHDGRVTMAFALDTEVPGTRWRYRAAFLAADGTILARFPYGDAGRVYVDDVRVVNGYVIVGAHPRVPPHLFDRVARVAIHASCE